MKLQDHVCTFEQAKRLKELGVKYPAGQESFFKWFECDTGETWKPGLFRPNTGEFDYMLVSGLEEGYNDEVETRGNWDAFTAAELMAMLPPSISFVKKYAILRVVKLDASEYYGDPESYIAGYYLSDKEPVKDWVMGHGRQCAAVALADLLIMVIEQGKTTIEAINNRLTP